MFTLKRRFYYSEAYYFGVIKIVACVRKFVPVLDPLLTWGGN